MAEGARLESVYTATYRGFESLSLRQFTALELFGRDFSNSKITLGIPAFIGFTNRRLYLTPQFFQNKAIEFLFEEKVCAADFDDGNPP